MLIIITDMCISDCEIESVRVNMTQEEKDFMAPAGSE